MTRFGDHFGDHLGDHFGGTSGGGVVPIVPTTSLHGDRLEFDLYLALSANPTSAPQAAEKITKAYYDYARLGTAAGYPPTFLDVARSRLFKGLLTTFLDPRGSLHHFASGFSSALTAFWAGTLFGVGTFTSFPTTTCTASLQAGLLHAPPSTRLAAKKISTSLHQATLLCIVTFPLPIGPVPLL